MMMADGEAKQGKDTLVTDGPYALLRHPNYTGATIYIYIS